jgi:hypothetical protein
MVSFPKVHWSTAERALRLPDREVSVNNIRRRVAAYPEWSARRAWLLAISYAGKHRG